MTNASMTPGSRPRRGVIGVLALLGAGALTAGIVLAAGEASDPPRVAGAVELATFSSCEDLAAWGAEATRAMGGGVDDSEDADVAFSTGELSAESGLPTAARAAEDGAASGAGTDETGGGGVGIDPRPQEPVDDETNRIVEGVDEIDLVDRLTEDVVLVSSASRMAVVDLDAAEVVEATSVPWDAQITYDAETGVAWVVGHPDEGGVLVERYAVGTEGFESEGRWTTPGWLVSARRIGDELHVVASDGFTGGMPMPVEPFAGGPVPCDEVLHPIGPSDPTATLLATLPATGAVEPVRATEVVGSGSLVHVTTGAIYLATPQWSGEETTTGIHRFDLATLQPTGSGSVAGTLLDEFSMSEHDGVLRVATTADRLVFGGRVAVDGPAVGGPAEDVSGRSTTTVAAAEPILNEIVVLDTEGTLDEIGRTERFGHPGETLHGIRFAGTTAYAVTFLQTDPFYVVDLSDPTDPRVVGEVELPGFSSYLHPLGDGLVVGFGPGMRSMAAKLFDVSDPTAPRVVGELDLGDETPVAYDHHAYLDLGDGRFAVPVTTYAASVTSSVVVVATAGGRLVEEARLTAATSEMATRVLTVDDGWALLAGPEVVVLDGAGGERARISL